MATSFDALVAELRAFDGKKEVRNAASRGIRAAVAPVRKAIKAAAIATLPAGGGLNKWVSRTRFTVQIKLSGRSAGIKLKGGRNSEGGRTDLKRIDNGRVRAPTFGHKTRATWHNQSVTPGFFAKTASEAPNWRNEVDREVDAALETIRRG